MSLVPSYTCTICQRTLTVDGPPIIGETAEQRLGRVAKMLSDHIGQTHQQQIAECFMGGNHFAGMLICHYFQHTDAELLQHTVSNAMGIRRFTGKYLGRYKITDEMIEAQIRQHLPLVDASTRLTVFEMLKGLRDSTDEAPDDPRIISKHNGGQSEGRLESLVHRTRP